MRNSLRLTLPFAALLVVNVYLRAMGRLAA